MATVEEIKQKIENKKIRLQAYQDKELEILKGGTKAYGIGTRSVTKYDAELAEVTSMIKTLESEIESLEKLLNGESPSIVFRFVPGDN